jgi:hypothetical protein
MPRTNQRVLAFARASRALNIERHIMRLEAEWKRLRAREQEIFRELEDLHASRESAGLAMESEATSSLGHPGGRPARFLAQWSLSADARAGRPPAPRSR